MRKHSLLVSIGVLNCSASLKMIMCWNLQKASCILAVASSELKGLVPIRFVELNGSWG